MTGAMRNWWWLIGGAMAMVVGVVLMVTVGAVGTCADFGVLYDGSTAPPATPCQDSLDAAQRNWIGGAVLFLVGMATVTFGFGYQRGRRSGLSEMSDAQGTS